MSLSFLKPNSHQTSQPNQPEKPNPTSDGLSLSQALLITAGLAGLIGLCSGSFIRFSLAESSHTRFLSPLQTFPDLPNWAPELPQGTADSHYLPGGSGETDILDGAPLDSASDNPQSRESSRTSSETWAQDSTDTEADRDESTADTPPSSDAEYTEEPYVEEPYTEPYVEEPYTEPYVEEPYAEEPYTEPYIEEPYAETEQYSQDYPAGAEPMPEEAPYAEESQW